MHKLKPFLPGTKELYCLQVQIILTGLITKEVALSYNRVVVEHARNPSRTSDYGYRSSAPR